MSWHICELFLYQNFEAEEEFESTFFQVGLLLIMEIPPTPDLGDLLGVKGPGRAKIAVLLVQAGCDLKLKL
jgi:hypothetical protein